MAAAKSGMDRPHDAGWRGNSLFEGSSSNGGETGRGAPMKSPNRRAKGTILELDLDGGDVVG